MPCRPHLPRGRLAGLAVLALLTAGASSAARAASLSAQAVEVLGKALAFAHLPSATTVAVVYAAGDAASRADAQQIAGEIGDSFQVHGVTLTPLVMDAAALAASRPAVVIAALHANGDAVMRVSRAQHALCVTADLAAVRSGACMMTIRSDPRVEIVLNAAAASAAGVSFPIAFHLMVREL